MLDIKNCFTHDGSGGLVQTITGDAASTNTLDLGAANKQLSGAGRPLWLVVKSIAAFVTLTSLEIALETDEDATFATDLEEIMTWDIALAKMTAGALLINQPLPVALINRHIRLYFNVVGANPGSGSTLYAHLADGPETAQQAVDLVTL